MTNKSSTISVLMANFNKEAYIEHAIENVLAIKEHILEFIIIDDCSTDNSCKIIYRFAINNQVIRVIENPSNKGVVYSTNKLVMEAMGDYVLLVSSDDYIIPENMVKLINAMKSNPGNGIYCGNHYDDYVGVSKRITVDPAFLKEPGYIESEEACYLVSFNNIPALGVILNRQVVMECGGYDSELKWYLDLFMNFEIAMKYGFYYLPEPVAVMRRFDGEGNYSAGNRNWTKAKPVLIHLFKKLQSNKYKHLYMQYIRYNLFRYYIGVNRLLLECPSLWDRYTIGIFVNSLIHCESLLYLRWNVIPLFIPKFLKEIYRKYRDKCRLNKRLALKKNSCHKI